MFAVISVEHRLRKDRVGAPRVKRYAVVSVEMIVDYRRYTHDAPQGFDRGGRRGFVEAGSNGGLIHQPQCESGSLRCVDRLLR